MYESMNEKELLSTGRGQFIASCNLSFSSSQLWVVLSNVYGELIVVLTMALCLAEVMDTPVPLLSLQVGSNEFALHHATKLFGPRNESRFATDRE